jgi:hypothetical protein
MNEKARMEKGDRTGNHGTKCTGKRKQGTTCTVGSFCGIAQKLVIRLLSKHSHLALRKI